MKITNRIVNRWLSEPRGKNCCGRRNIDVFTRAARKYGMVRIAEELISVCNYIIKNRKIQW